MTMNGKEVSPITIGMVNYINTAPVYEVWKQSVDNPRWDVVEAHPSCLNRMLAEDKLDLGFVSCFEYAVRPEKYRILEDLSISASGPVGSVFLFSKVGIQDLVGRQVLLSDQSETSACLVKIILEEFYGLEVNYQTGGVFSELADESLAVMAIGDDALRLANSNQYPIKLDLGDVWFKHTGLPFVYAVCAVQETACRNHPQEISRIQREFVRCRKEGAAQLHSICQSVSVRIPMDCDVCYDYLRGLEYDLGAKKQQALERFFGYLIKRGEISSDALPLKIVS